MKNKKEKLNTVRISTRLWAFFQKLRDTGWYDYMVTIEGLKKASIQNKIENGKVVLPKTALPNTVIFRVGIKSEKKIYDKKYKKLVVLVKNLNFIKKIVEIRIQNNIPQDGFKNEEDYKSFVKRKQLDRDYKFDENWKHARSDNKWLNRGKSRAGVHFGFYMEEKLRKKISFLLDSFSLAEDFRSPILNFIIYNNLDYENIVFEMQLRNNRNKDAELWIKILPHTKKKDFIHAWSNVALFQKHLSGYKGKLKEHTKFDRDFEIYNLYEEYSSSFGKRKRAESLNNLIEIKGPIDVYIHQKINAKYPDISLSNIRRIISRYKNYIGTDKELP